MPTDTRKYTKPNPIRMNFSPALTAANKASESRLSAVPYKKGNKHRFSTISNNAAANCPQANPTPNHSHRESKLANNLVAKIHSKPNIVE